MAKDRAKDPRQSRNNDFLRDVAKVQARIQNGQLKKEIKTGEAIGRLKERYPRVKRDITFADLRCEDATKLEQTGHSKRRRKVAASLDGSYLLRTDREDVSAEEAWRIYSSLTRAENAFRCMKSPLSERPIFHQLEHRVEAHIFLCVLAYHLLVAIETTLLRQEIHTSWATVRDLLATHEIATIVLPTDQDGVLRIRRSSDSRAECPGFVRGQLGIPIEIMRPVKTWGRTRKHSD